MSAESKQPRNWSHLNPNQERGKIGIGKAICFFCYTPYLIEASDALRSNDYCSLQCECEDEWVENRYQK